MKRAAARRLLVVLLVMFALTCAGLAARYDYLPYRSAQQRGVEEIAPSSRSSVLHPASPFAAGPQESQRDNQAKEKVGGSLGPPTGKVVTANASGPQPKGGNSSHVLRHLHPDDDISPDSVVGRPFPVSASVARQWKNVPLTQEMAGLLDQFTQEQRDVQWAPVTESHIYDLIADYPDITPRAIECRSSICMFEVSYTWKAGFSVIDDRYLLDQVRFIGDVWGFETDETNQQIKVMLEVVTRK